MRGRNTMEVDINPAFSINNTSTINLVDNMMNHLCDNDNVIFKSQQRGESNLDKNEKLILALEAFEKNKVNFLSRFGKFLKPEHLDYFKQYENESPEGVEITILLRNFYKIQGKDHLCVRNRRFEALKHLLEENKYFSEVEMMKRNPQLYDQLVGQYLSKKERVERDKACSSKNATLVDILMEGIERDEAEKRRKLQEIEDQMEDDSEEQIESEPPSPSDAEQPGFLWGEMKTDKLKSINRKINDATTFITAQERTLLKEEFITSMYQSFLDGKDKEFDYDNVDNNDSYDNIEEEEHDEEDKYFDSEEPETVEMDDSIKNGKQESSSEDELDIYMSALNEHPTISKLSKDMKNL